MQLPNHIAIIVDGNRRWARKKGFPLVKGHQRAANEIIEPLVYHCLSLDIPYITFWVWSTENWKRGKKFAQMMFSILKKGLKKSMVKYIKDGIKLNTIGDLTKLPQDLVKDIKNWQEKSKKNKKLVVTFAINYGGRDEIIRAIRKMTQTSKKITQTELEKYLDTAGMPDPDLIIRTGGEKRLSGFLLWQSEYAELYFTKTLFPDFRIEEFDQALKKFSQRQRRFGA